MTGAIWLVCGGIVLLWLVQTGKFTAIKSAWTAPPTTTPGITNAPK